MTVDYAKNAELIVRNVLMNDDARCSQCGTACEVCNIEEEDDE